MGEEDRNLDQNVVWLECQDDEGHVYYYNTVTQESTWTLPENVVEVQLLKLMPQESRSKLSLEIERAKTLDNLYAKRLEGAGIEADIGGGQSTAEGEKDDDASSSSSSASSPASLSSSTSSSSSSEGEAEGDLEEEEDGGEIARDDDLNANVMANPENGGQVNAKQTNEDHQMLVLMEEKINCLEAELRERSIALTKEKEKNETLFEEAKTDFENEIEEQKKVIRNEFISRNKAFINILRINIQDRQEEVNLLPTLNKNAAVWITKLRTGLELMDEMINDAYGAEQTIKEEILEGIETQSGSESTLEIEGAHILSEKMFGLKQSLREERFRGAALLEENKLLQEQILESRSVFESQLRVARDELEKALEQFEKEKEELASSLLNSETMISTLRIELKESRAELNQQKLELVSESKKAEALTKELEIGRNMKTQNEDLKARVSVLLETADYYRIQHERSVSNFPLANPTPVTVSTLGDVEENTDVELIALRCEFDEYRSEKERELSDLSAVLTKVESTLDVTRQRLQETEKQAQREREDHRNRIAEIDAEKSAAQIALEEEEGRHFIDDEESSQAVPGLAKGIERAAMEELEQELHEKEIRLIDAESRAESFRIRLCEKESQSKSLGKEKIALSNQVRDLNESCEELRRIHEEEEELFAKERYELREKVEKVELELEQTICRLQEAERNFKTVNEEAIALHESASSALKEIDLLNEEGKNFEATFEKERMHWKNENEELKTELKELRTEVKALKNESVRALKKSDLNVIVLRMREYKQNAVALKRTVVQEFKDIFSIIEKSRQAIEKFSRGKGPESSTREIDKSREGGNNRSVQLVCRIEPRSCDVLESSILMASKRKLELCNKVGKSRIWNCDGLIDAHLGNESLFGSLHLAAFCFASMADTASFCAIFLANRNHSASHSIVGSKFDPGLLAHCVFNLTKNIGFSNHSMHLEKLEASTQQGRILYRSSSVALKSLDACQAVIESLENSKDSSSRREEIAIVEDGCVDRKPRQHRKKSARKSRSGGKAKESHLHRRNSVYTIFVDSLPRIQFLVLEDHEGEENSDEKENLVSVLREAVEQWLEVGSLATAVLCDVPFLNQLFFLHTSHGKVFVVPHVSPLIEDADSSAITMNQAADIRSKLSTRSSSYQ